MLCNLVLLPFCAHLECACLAKSALIVTSCTAYSTAGKNPLEFVGKVAADCIREQRRPGHIYQSQHVQMVSPSAGVGSA